VTLPKQETHTFPSSNFGSPYLNNPCTKSLQTRNLGHSTCFLGAHQLTAHDFAFSISQIFGGWGGSTEHRRTLAHARLLGMLWDFLGMFFSISSRCSHLFNQCSLCFRPQHPISKPSPIFLSHTHVALPTCRLTLTELRQIIFRGGCTYFSMNNAEFESGGVAFIGRLFV
jgi:hypothetical protein